jgi:hypothetical protein
MKAHEYDANILANGQLPVPLEIINKLKNEVVPIVKTIVMWI